MIPGQLAFEAWTKDMAAVGLAPRAWDDITDDERHAWAAAEVAVLAGVPDTVGGSIAVDEFGRPAYIARFGFSMPVCTCGAFTASADTVNATIQHAIQCPCFVAPFTMVGR